MSSVNASSRAQEAVDLVQAQPSRAAELAQSVLTDEASSLEAQATARWALGLVERERDELSSSKHHLEAAIEMADTAGARHLAARIQSSLALVLAYLGDHQASLAATEAAAKELKGGDAARNRMQQGLILQRTGDFDGALEAYRLALAGFKPANDEIAEVRLRLNRSVIHTYRGELTSALRDLETAMAIAQRNHQSLQVAACAHNLGWVYGRRGEIPTALKMFDTAETAYAEVEAGGGRPAVLAIDRAEVLGAAGMLDEAWSEISSAITSLAGSGNVMDLAEAQLLAARMALAKDDPEAAGELASQALDAFEHQERSGWGLQAQWLMLRAETGPPDITAVAELVNELARRGWEAEAVQARFETGRLALGAGDESLGRRMLMEASQTKNRSALVRAQAQHAAALLAISAGDRRRAGTALRGGLRALVEHRASFGSAEMRAQASSTSRALASLATGLALESGTPWQVLTAVEAWRAIAMQLPPVRPPKDQVLAAELTDLRRLDAELAEAQTRSESTERLQTRRASLERSIRSRARRTEGSHASDLSTLNREALRDQLSDTGLVAFFTFQGSLRAVTMAGGRSQIWDLGSPDPIAEEVQAMVFALHRLALGRSSQASLEAAANLLLEVGKSLSETLLTPMQSAIADRPLVIIPTGVLHRLPWLALPPLQGRPVVVAPSVTSWLSASARLRPIKRSSRTVFASGPGLVAGAQEARRLARLYEKSVLLTGPRASVEAVKTALGRAEVGHVAAHGAFRADNALFSSLRMADGPMTIYDLETLNKIPRLLVLPACDVAVSQVLAGDELLGLANALLRLGSASLVAPVVPIPDQATLELMVAFHRALLSGSTPAEALAKSTQPAADDPATLAAQSAFLVLGAG